MMQPPSLEHPTSTTPSVPRYRRWAVHLAIVVACIGSVATSPSATSPQVIAEYEGPPLGLTTRATTATRHFKVRVSVQEQSFDRVELLLRAQVTARWSPTDPNNHETPWLLTRLYIPSDNDSGPGPGRGEVLILGKPNQPLTVEPLTSDSSECKTDQGCEWTVPLEFELLPHAAEGSVEVEWKVTAEAYAEGATTLPKGFTVQVSEP
ncbi:hypothetical protein F0U62_06350 [Cystobacter fuscus]|uniref:hypothetical protein n=1 Tax=Cystobacter fuscus TaxID=43 RepID=UPI002B2A6019|nr:hypothetical protein F0U62_06350 [Cystobacter fuscus]